MSWCQTTIQVKAPKRGFFLITSEITGQCPELQSFNVGLCHLFMQHTSASLTINENYDPDVRIDFESHMNKMVPENAPYYVHTLEGPDDMPAHLKSSLLGNSLSIPISNGSLNLGTWQGIYLCEHRDHPTSRRIVVTLQGE